MAATFPRCDEGRTYPGSDFMHFLKFRHAGAILPEKSSVKTACTVHGQSDHDRMLNIP